LIIITKILSIYNTQYYIYLIYCITISIDIHNYDTSNGKAVTVILIAILLYWYFDDYYFIFYNIIKPKVNTDEFF